MEPDRIAQAAMITMDTCAGLTRPPSRRANRINRPVMMALMMTPLFIVWLSTYTNIDLMLADAAFDFQQGEFPWQHVWLTEAFNHVILKNILVVLGIAVISAAAWDLAFPGVRSPLRRLQIRIVALSAILVPTAIAMLKQASSAHCPWDLERYGGTEPYIRLLQALPSGTAPGHCLPAGHASSALWLISLAVFLLPRHPRAAALAVYVLLAFGLATGWLQQLRGAHFLTHTMWSMWIACVIVVALLVLLDRRGILR